MYIQVSQHFFLNLFFKYFFIVLNTDSESLVDFWVFGKFLPLNTNNCIGNKRTENAN